MARERTGQLVATDATAVVTDPDHPDPAGFDFNGYRPGAGIEAVFNKLLDHRSRPLDNFSSSNLVDQMRR